MLFGISYLRSNFYLIIPSCLASLVSILIRPMTSRCLLIPSILRSPWTKLGCCLPRKIVSGFLYPWYLHTPLDPMHEGLPHCFPVDLDLAWHLLAPYFSTQGNGIFNFVTLLKGPKQGLHFSFCRIPHTKPLLALSNPIFLG